MSGRTRTTLPAATSCTDPSIATWPSVSATKTSSCAGVSPSASWVCGVVTSPGPTSTWFTRSSVAPSGSVSFRTAVAHVLNASESTVEGSTTLKRSGILRRAEAGDVSPWARGVGPHPIYSFRSRA